jgi:DNA topoisomerase-1
MAVHEIDCNGPGIARVGAGRGFFYRDANGTRIEDPDVLERIRDLAIPPAWREVWICSDPNGHIQAVGLDAKGRRQYRYHDEWQAARSREKHERVLRFARRLPALRERVEADLGQEDLPRDRVLACAVRLLELGFFRVGGEAYAEENGSYGLATLRKEHAKVRGTKVEFAFEAKSGQHQRCQVVDPTIAEVLGRLRRRRIPPEAELLAYRDDDGQWVDVTSDDINRYIQSVLGDEFSAKDFRTWVGTVLAAVGLSDEEPPDGEQEARRAVARVTAEVAEHLGNTPAVARSAYIDPRVVERFEEDDTLDDPSELDDLEVLEAEVIRLIRRAG